MRYIDPAEIERRLTDDEWKEWVEQARAGLEELQQLTDAEARKERIGRRPALWSTLATLLGEVSNQKCWYCESKELRSDNPVDHFRPKGRVYENRNHGGYWWLAFDWRNFRFGCTYCNSYRRSERTRGGKQDRFPLLTEEDRALTCEHKISKEKPVLLDPIDPEDPELVTFEGDGRAVPSAPPEQKVAHSRAKDSIDIYHLNEREIRQARWKRMYEVRDRLERAAEIYERRSQGDPAAQVEWKRCLADLLRWKKEAARFSSATLSELRRRQDNPLAVKVLQR